MVGCWSAGLLSFVKPFVVICDYCEIARVVSLGVG